MAEPFLNPPQGETGLRAERPEDRVNNPEPSVDAFGRFLQLISRMASGPPGFSTAAMPDTKGNKAFKEIVARRLSSQGGMMPSSDYVKNMPPRPPLEKTSPYPHMDEPWGGDNTKFIVRPETELQKAIYNRKSIYKAEPFDWPKEYWGPGDESRLGRFLDKNSDVVPEDANRFWHPQKHGVRIPILQGDEVTKDLLWGPPPTFEGDYIRKIPPGQIPWSKYQAD